jgi:hypothetical protein
MSRYKLPLPPNIVRHPRYGAAPIASGLELPPVEVARLFGIAKTDRIFPHTAIAADPARQHYTITPRRYYVDILRNCRQCGHPFFFFAREQQHWYETLGFNIWANALDCPSCRHASHEEQVLLGAYAAFFKQQSPTDSDIAQALGIATQLLNLGAIRHLDKPRQLKNLALRRIPTDRAIRALIEAIETAEADQRYHDWLDFHMDRPEPPNGWHLDNDCEPFQASNAEHLRHYQRLFTHCATDLARFSPAQIESGLRNLFDSGCGDTVFIFQDTSLPIAERLAAFNSIRTLYCDCFEPLCTPAHADFDGTHNPLSTFCYMLWDITPLLCWRGSPEKEIWHTALLDLLADVLESTNSTCIDSALHGLGHFHRHENCNARIEAIIAQFLRQHPELPPEQRAYAESAAQGRVQ